MSSFLLFLNHSPYLIGLILGRKRILAMLPVSTGYSHTAGLAKSETESKVIQSDLVLLLRMSWNIFPHAQFRLLLSSRGNVVIEDREFWLKKTSLSSCVNNYFTNVKLIYTYCYKGENSGNARV